MKEVEYHPPNHNIVVHSNDHGDDNARETDPPEVGTELVPGPDGATLEGLPDSALHVEQRNAHNKQHDKVRDKECCCG